MGLPSWQNGKESACHAEDLQETRFLSLGREDPLEKEMAATPVLFFFFAWEIPWTEEPGGLQFMG